MTETPSFEQILNRIQWAHLSALRNVALTGYPRCSRVVMATLHRWEAVETQTERPYRSTLTDLGTALLEAKGR